MVHILGDRGEVFAKHLLEKRGYQVTHLGGNYPVIDLEVRASSNFRVSVKTSSSKRHVRMGRESSIGQLGDDDFMFAFMPKVGAADIDFDQGLYDLLILPGAIAREGGLFVHHAYLAGRPSTGSFGVTVKGESRRAAQIKIWTEFQDYFDRWDLLPAPQ